ncbi:AMP-binding protein [Leifsonia sp. YAF41]|uniref:AMP-binding protein n=1 Tax=Leifsonia sp. YAF41 TaxID=3233086 RepID=UPI003F9D9298
MNIENAAPLGLSPSAHVDSFTRDRLPPRDTWPTFEFTLPELQYKDRLNAAEELIDAGVARFGSDRIALSTPAGETWTYGDLQRRSNQVAQVLTEDFAVIPGNRVMLRFPNSPWAVASWLGVLKAGAVVVTTMTAWRKDEIRAIVGKTAPTVILTDHRFLDDLEQAAITDADIVIVGGERDQLIAACEAKNGLFEAVKTAADDVALLGPTSGTTGVPKVTMHFHRDILANADTFARHILEIAADDVCAGSPPLAFTFGLGGLVVFPLRYGASTLLTERATPVELAEFVSTHGVTVLYTAPTAYRAILKADKAEHLRGLRVAVSAGEHLPRETFEAVEQSTGLRLVDGIGATEMLHVFISAANGEIRPGATGRAVPGYRATILGDDGTELPANQPGRLAIIGPTGCRYLDDDRQSNYVVNGWNVTGDTYQRDDDGYFTFQARSDSMIVAAGYNVGAPEVEAVIDQHPDVLECAVIGRPDAEKGIIIAAYVVAKDGVTTDDALAESIKALVKENLAIYKCPRRVDFVDSLPRNPSGKLQHFRLRERAAAEAAAELLAIHSTTNEHEGLLT